MVGRTAEVQRLQELLQQIQEDQGQIAAIIAEAGMGKSRLVTQFKTLVQGTSVQWVEASCPSELAHPYELFRTVTKALVGSEDQTFAKFNLAGADGDFLRLLIHPGEPNQRLTSMSEEEIKQGLFQSVRTLFQQTIKKPYVIVLEDLHFAHPLTLELMQFILDSVEELPLLLVLVHRPELEVTWNRRLNYNEIRLSPLGSDELGQIAKRMLGVDEISLKLRNSLEKHTQGNPLFTEEIVRHLVETKKIQFENEKSGKKVVRAEDESLQSVPSNIQNVILNRFKLLSENSRQLLLTASLFGNPFDADDFESFSQQNNTSSSQADLKLLFTQNFLTEKSTFPKRVHQFMHHLIHSVIATTVPGTKKEEMHTEIAHFLRSKTTDPSLEKLNLIAQHDVLGTPSLRSVENLVLTANTLASAIQFSQALVLFEGAMKHWKQANLSIKDLNPILSSYIDLVLKVGDLKKCKTLFELWESFFLKPSDIPYHYPYYKMKYETQVTNFEEAHKWAERATSHFIGTDRKKEHYDILSTKALALSMMGRNEEALKLSLETLQTFQNNNEFVVEQIYLRLRAANALTSMGNPQQAYEYIQEAEKCLNDKTPIVTKLEFFKRSAFTLSRLGKHHDAALKCSQLIEIAKEHGFKQYMARAFLDRGIEYTECGSYSHSFDDYREASRIADTIHDEIAQIRSICGQFDNLLDLGVIGEAEDLWKKNRTRLLGTSNQWYQANMHFLFAQLCEVQGKYEEAQTNWEITKSICKKTGSKSTFGRAHMNGIRTHLSMPNTSVLSLTNEFNVFATEELKGSVRDNHFHVIATAMLLASKGGNPKVGLDLKLNIQDCSLDWLKQLLYVSKIRYLDFRGKKNEAKTLRKEYELVRQEMSKKIPKEYINDFMNHPIYKVPT